MFKHKLAIVLSFVCAFVSAPVFSAPPAHIWLTLPPIPKLPAPAKSGYASVNGIQLWYAEYGSGRPVVLLHGGLANAAWWGNQIPVLAKHYRVIAVDSRGQGRSSHDPGAQMTYRLMASDVVALMNYLHLPKAAIVGWSDGSDIGLELAIHHPDRLTKLFAFGANTDPSGYRTHADRSAAENAVVARYVQLMRVGYMKLSPTPQDYDAFYDKMNELWQTEPQITAKQLQGITVPTWIVDGDHDELIKRENVDFQFSEIPGAVELIVPGTSHFAFLQKPVVMNDALLRFMAWQPKK